MKKYRAGALALAITVGLMLSACGAQENKSEKPADKSQEVSAPVTLNMMAAIYSDQTKGLWEGFIKAFNKEHPNIKINLEMQSWDNINQVIKTKVQANQAPDILSIDAFSSYVADDMLYSADEVLSPDTIADFQPSFVDNATMNGKQYGFPLIASARALFYNDELFTKAGLDPKADFATWDEMKAAAKKIAALGEGTYGYGMPLGSEESQAELGMWIFSNGGSYGDIDKLTINSKQNVEAAKYMQSMITAGVTQPDAGATNRTPMFNNVFAQGKIGMMVGLPPLVGMLAKDTPSLKYTIHPFPSKDGKSSTTLGVADHLMVFKNGDEARGKAAGAFLDFFYKSENYVKFIDTEGFLPVTKSGAEATTKTEFEVFNKLLPSAKFYPSTNKDWGAAQGQIQQQIGTIAQKADPQAVLDKIQKAVDQGL